MSPCSFRGTFYLTATLFLLKKDLQDFDQCGAKDGGVGDGDDVGEGRTLCEDGDGQAEQEVLLEGEVCGEVDPAVVVAGVLDGLDDGHVLLVDVDEAEVLWARRVVAPVALGRDGERQQRVLVRVDLRGRGVEGQYAERLAQVDGVDVGARPGHDHVLEQCVECELAGAGGQECVGRWDLLQEVAVEAVLLAFLSDDGPNSSDQAVVTVQAEVGLDVRQRAKDDIGERLSKCDGGLEVSGW